VPQDSARSTEAAGEPSTAERKRSSAEEPDGRQPPSVGPAVGTRFSSEEIHDHVLEAADAELERPLAALFWSALAAGLVIGWSLVVGAYLTTITPEFLHRAVAAAAYPIGFIFVIIGRSQLFTENTLEPVLPVLERRNLSTLRRMLRLWGIVLLGNVVGALIFAWLLARTQAVDAELRNAMLTMSEKATTGGVAFTLYRAVFAGWLIALTAWLVAATQMTGAQIVLIWLTTAPISAFGFRHSVVGAVEALYVAAAGAWGWGSAIGQFIVPAVLGNIVGGVIFVALVNHKQVAADKRAAS
jgi:formate/nitrite transporter FocA (FNT family)